MATTYKVLGQQDTTGTTAYDIYTVPAATSTIVSTVTVCNTSASALTYNIAVRPAGATLATKHYISKGEPIAAGASVAYTLGLTLATTDKVTVSASATGVVFNLFGTELS